MSDGFFSGGGFAGDPGAPAGVTDHGALTGLADDDHTQYALVDGSRAFTGAITTTSSGTATVPAVAVGGTAAGLWEPAANNLGFSATDEYRWYFGANPWVYLDGNELWVDGSRSLNLGKATGPWQNCHLAKAVYMTEMTAPTGTANKATLFAVDIAGKTALQVIFGSGAAITLAIEI